MSNSLPWFNGQEQSPIYPKSPAFTIALAGTIFANIQLTRPGLFSMRSEDIPTIQMVKLQPRLQKHVKLNNQFNMSVLDLARGTTQQGG